MSINECAADIKALKVSQHFCFEEPTLWLTGELNLISIILNAYHCICILDFFYHSKQILNGSISKGGQHRAL